jgi:FkbM family methyltransferase
MSTALLTPSPEVKRHLKQLSRSNPLPTPHLNYLNKLKQSGFEPRVIYDIGACVLHWANAASTVWPAAEIIVFEAFEACSFLYEEEQFDYHMGVLSKTDGDIVQFYQNEQLPGGNSYYREVGCDNGKHFPESCAISKVTSTLDTIVKTRNFPLPDLIKMDVQGAEMDVIMGAQNTLQHTQHLIVEMQRVNYNDGAPKVEVTRPYIESLGWKCITPLFCDNGPDGDYHFSKDQSFKLQ